MIDINYKPVVIKHKPINRLRVGFHIIAFLLSALAICLSGYNKDTVMVIIHSFFTIFNLLIVYYLIKRKKNSRPRFKVQFMRDGSMKYWIVLGKTQEELRIDGKPVAFLTEEEVNEIKQELNRRWEFCEQEALRRAYEDGYKSKSKLL